MAPPVAAARPAGCGGVVTAFTGLLIAMAALVPLAVVAGPTPAGAQENNPVHSAVQVTGQNAWTATQVSLGLSAANSNSHACALTTASPSGIRCWGYNSNGQVGNNTTTNPIPFPVNVSALTTANGAGTSPVVATGPTQALASASTHSCVIFNSSTVTGGVQCWGRNSQGELGNLSTSDSHVPVVVQTSAGVALQGVTAIAAGGTSDPNGTTCAVVSGGVDCWGNNSDGQLGYGSCCSSTGSGAPRVAIAASSGVTAVAVGEKDSCRVVQHRGRQVLGPERPRPARRQQHE